jgi:glutamyl-tRNA reductase
MRLLAAGVNHKTAPVAVREKLALHPDHQAEVLRNLAEHPDVAEALILSTCNRFELYVVESVCQTGLPIEDLVAEAAHTEPEVVGPHLYTLENLEAARHLFGVASGADSMVLGECEIMGQVRDAADIARGARTLGTVLTRLTDYALQTGKRARNETSIDQGCVSLASIAVSLSRQICGDPRRMTVLVVGAGDTAELTLKRLVECGTRKVFVANRTLARAVRLAEEFGGQAIPLSGIYEAMAEADVVIASTHAPHPIVREPEMRPVVRARGARPLFLIDLAVPRDIDPTVGNLENVFVYDLDSLEAAVTDALRGRESQLPRVKEICAEAAGEFWAWAASLDLLPTLLELREKAEALRKQELERAVALMGDLSPRQQKHLHLLSKRIVQGLIGEPLDRLRSKACEGDGLAYLSVLRELFDLTESESEAAGADAPEGDLDE